MNWTPETYTFLATSASTTLSFVSTTAGAFGPAIDNVVITETVPTKSDCKDGGWQAMIDNAGNHFKNQGDCVSYFATGGQEPGRATASHQRERQRHDRQATSVTSQVKHSTKGHHQATVQHTNRQSGPKNKPNDQAGHRHGSKSK